MHCQQPSRVVAAILQEIVQGDFNITNANTAALAHEVGNRCRCCIVN